MVICCLCNFCRERKGGLLDLQMVAVRMVVTFLVLLTVLAQEHGLAQLFLLHQPFRVCRAQDHFAQAQRHHALQSALAWWEVMWEGGSGGARREGVQPYCSVLWNKWSHSRGEADSRALRSAPHMLIMVSDLLTCRSVYCKWLRLASKGLTLEESEGWLFLAENPRSLQSHLETCTDHEFCSLFLCGASKMDGRWSKFPWLFSSATKPAFYLCLCELIHLHSSTALLLSSFPLDYLLVDPPPHTQSGDIPLSPCRHGVVISVQHKAGGSVSSPMEGAVRD